MSHMFTSEISAVKDWLSRVPMPQWTAHRAITLIIRLDAEIERLYKSLNLTAREQYINGRNDGIKEFAERLNKQAFCVQQTEWEGRVVDCEDIDSLVKEMTEEHNGNV